jgi:hypothetical protein
VILSVHSSRRHVSGGEQAKRYIAEAVACYRAGAFRSCIVATWIAVVFDFVEKLNQLELAGDANAKKRRGEFERYREHGDVNGSLLFERQVPAMAREEFELISDLERSDLERLIEDRNRCAHDLPDFFGPVVTGERPLRR